MTSPKPMTTPAPIIDTHLASILHLGRHGLRCIGYWRGSADPVADPNRGNPYSASMLAYYEAHGRTGDAETHRRKREAFNWLPWPGDHVDPSMLTEERERIAAMLDAAPDLGGYRGSSWDRLATPDEHGRVPSNGSSERGEAGFCWPSGLSHYVRAYGLRLDPVFLGSLETVLGGDR